MQYLQGIRVWVLGLGESGLAMARWCTHQGAASVMVWDSRADAPGWAVVTQELPTAQAMLVLPQRDDLQEQLQGVDWILKSPGLAVHDARIAPLLSAAQELGKSVLGELDLWTRAMAELKHGATVDPIYAPQVLAITGTNGKTTTTALTTLLVQRAGKRAVAAGNIGPTLLDTLAQALRLPIEQRPEVWVLELSSFQLDGGGKGVAGFEPDAAVVLNISQDHLDWHGDMASYAQAKARIYGAARESVWPSTTMIVNCDDAVVEAMVPEPIPTKGSRGRPGRAIKRKVVRFGLKAPTSPGDFGVVQENGLAWLVRAHPDAEPEDAAEPLLLQRLMPADALRIRGRHNAANALAALALAQAIGCAIGPMIHGLREYVGEPHRVSWVARVADIEFIDDSKGTNVGATLAAINGLGADQATGRLVLLLGGDGKGQDFSPLAEPIMRHARAVAVYGQDADAIAQALKPCSAAGLPLACYSDLPAAFDAAVTWAQAGDTVVLSPACASLDQFRNYAHRAEVFVELVRSFASVEGVMI
jgi:UDP-N-acetylmuramoylalanine--D-glutamate ligase